MLATTWTLLARIEWCILILIAFAFLANRAFPDDGPNEVDMLASNNSPWIIKGRPGKETATKGNVYDANESKRIGAQVTETVRKNEELWPDLVSHLDDKRHSGVVGIDAGYPRNWTVGDVCQNIIGESLSSPFYRHFPGTKMNYHRFKIPSFAKEKEQLKAWYDERKDRKLYELQIEACKWALLELESPDIHERDISNAKRVEIANKIQDEIQVLQESKTAVPCTIAYDVR